MQLKSYLSTGQFAIQENGRFVFRAQVWQLLFVLIPIGGIPLTRRLQKYPMLFWGYSLRVPGTLEALDPDTIRGRAHKDKWIVLTPDAAQPQAQAYYRALGMSIIVADASEMLDYLENLLAFHNKTQPSQLARNTKSLFPKEAIPKIGTVPPRPIREFYLGAPPSWYDIYHGNIPRTHHFAKLMDMIHSGRHVVVTGIPGCGKTTLMMQAAAELSVEKHKLVFDYIPGEKADLVINRLQGEPAVIFIDNFADSVGAMERLCFASNVQVIAFDRYYNYDIISHQVRAVCPYLIDVTDLSEHDVQEIVSIIPDAIKVLLFNGPTWRKEVNHQSTNHPAKRHWGWASATL